MHSSVVIVSPAAAGANNGNARTAQRWCEMLGSEYDCRVVPQWPDARAAREPGPSRAAVGAAARGMKHGARDENRDAVMIALHARRSAASIAAWARANPARPLVVVLTGTDLYQDLETSAEARESLELATRLVVLQERGVDALPSHLQGKTRVIVQSAPALAPLPKAGTVLNAVMVGHLRAVKAPRVLFAAARELRAEEGVAFVHIGDDSADPELGAEARALHRECPHYRWLGALPYDATRAHIRQADVLVHTSAHEGGAHVVIEAVQSGTPVLASRIAGNVGLLGDDYRGYFPAGDSASLAALLREARRTMASADGLLMQLAAQCAERAHLFAPERERAALALLLRESGAA